MTALAGTSIASVIGVFFQRPGQTGKIKDTCWACSRSVYEGEIAVSYLGLWFHPDCYHSEIVTHQSTNPDYEEDAAE